MALLQPVLYSSNGTLSTWSLFHSAQFCTNDTCSNLKFSKHANERTHQFRCKSRYAKCEDTDLPALVALFDETPGTAAIEIQTRRAYTTESPRKSITEVMPRRGTYPGGGRHDGSTSLLSEAAWSSHDAAPPLRLGEMRETSRRVFISLPHRAALPLSGCDCVSMLP